MATKVIMPKQGLQMTEGTIVRWIVGEGEKCTADQPLFEMETDKLTITMDAPASGTLLKIVHGEGDVVPITEMIAVIGEEGEDISGLLAEAAPKKQEQTAAPAEEKREESAQKADAPAGRAAGDRVFSTPRARMRAEERGADVGDIPGSGPEGLVIERDVLAFEPAAARKATPLAKKVAEAEGVDISDIEGSGSHGKITKDDVMAAVAARTGAGTARGTKIVPYAGMRRIVGEKMVESLRVHAQLTHKISVDMTNAALLRDTYKKQDKKVSYNDLVILATTRALKDYPMMNSTITDEGIVVPEYVHMGVAVAVDAGLIVPVIKDADLMRLEEISVVAKDLAARAKNNRLRPDEYKGSTFTVSNLGMFGLKAFTAIINTPESGILAVGAIEKTPVVVDDEIAIRPIMNLTLTYDHRVVDGAPAAQFLKQVKTYLENPCLML